MECFMQFKFLVYLQRLQCKNQDQWGEGAAMSRTIHILNGENKSIDFSVEALEKELILMMLICDML